MRKLVVVHEAKPIGIERLLEWAFGAEKAQLDPADGAERMGWTTAGGGGMEFVLMQRARLGCKIDGRGPSPFYGPDTHPDADAVAATCKGALDWRDATMVAGYARAGTRPNWMPGAEPRVVPAGGHNQHGLKTEQANPGPKYPGGTWRDWMKKPTIRRCQQNGLDLTPGDVEHLHWIGRVCPIALEPTVQMINSCRLEYLRWWGALQTVREHLEAGNVLHAHRLTREMPPAIPWTGVDVVTGWDLSEDQLALGSL